MAFFGQWGTNKKLLVPIGFIIQDNMHCNHKNE